MTTINRIFITLFLLMCAFAFSVAFSSCATGNSPIAQAIADKLANQTVQAKPEPTEAFKIYFAR